MSDIQQVLPLHIHPWTRWSVGIGARVVNALTNPASSNWVAPTPGTTGDAVYIPFHIPFQYPVNRVFWGNGSVITGSAHCDFGIFTPTGGLVYHTGSVLQGAPASGPQYVTPATPFLLAPGRYYFGLWCDSSTNHIYGAGITAVLGVQLGLQTQSNLTGGLPASATFGAYTTAVMPICGITRTISGF